MKLEIGMKVYSVYDDTIGTILDVHKCKALQDEYTIKWENGTVSRVPREEIY